MRVICDYMGTGEGMIVSIMQVQVSGGSVTEAFFFSRFAYCSVTGGR